MLSNAYFLAKFRFDTAENEPAQKFVKIAEKILILLLLRGLPGDRSAGYFTASSQQSGGRTWHVSKFPMPFVMISLSLSYADRRCVARVHRSSSFVPH